MENLHPDIMAEIDRAVTAYPASLITMINQEGVFYYASPSARDLLGYNPDEVLDQSFASYVDPADIEHLFLAVQDAMLNDQSIDVTMRSRTKSGGFKRMRGHAWKVTDPSTDQVFILARADPLD